MVLRSLTSVVTTAAESSSGDPAISPVAVGGIAFGILLLMLLAVLAFGKGREHS